MDTLIFIIEILGTAAFAVSGAITAIKKRMDMFGIIILGMTTAVGGGVIRDIILGRTPPAAFTYPIYSFIAILFSAVMLIPGIRKRFIQNNTIYNKVMFILDTIGLGLFTVMGVGIAFEASEEYNMFLVVFVGVVTGVGGGVLRDVLSGNIPYIFVKHIYACAAVAGALVCAGLWGAAGKAYAMLLGMAVIFIIRSLSAYFRWNLPVTYDKEEYM